MAKHIYTGDGKFYQGLPASDIESEALTPAQLVLLESGVLTGMYEIEGAVSAPPKPLPVSDVPQPVPEPIASEPEQSEPPTQEQQAEV